VSVEVELAIVDPSPTRLEALALARHPIEARFQLSPELPESEPATGTRHGIEDRDATNVHVHGRLLNEEEGQVEGAQVLRHRFHLGTST